MDNPVIKDRCIGGENKDEIRTLREKIKLLELEIKHIKTTMVTSQALNKLELEMVELKASIQEMKNNRQEDRESIRALNLAIEEVSSRLEEYLEGNAKVLANQMISTDKQERIEKTLSDMLDRFDKMDDKIDRANIFNQFKMFYNKNKINRWICRLAIVMVSILTISIFSFFMSGGDTFFEIINEIKELKM